MRSHCIWLIWSGKRLTHSPRSPPRVSAGPADKACVYLLQLARRHAFPSASRPQETARAPDSYYDIPNRGWPARDHPIRSVLPARTFPAATVSSPNRAFRPDWTRSCMSSRKRFAPFLQDPIGLWIRTRQLPAGRLTVTFLESPTLKDGRRSLSLTIAFRSASREICLIAATGWSSSRTGARSRAIKSNTSCVVPTFKAVAYSHMFASPRMRWSRRYFFRSACGSSRVFRIGRLCIVSTLNSVSMKSAR